MDHQNTGVANPCTFSGSQVKGESCPSVGDVGNEQSKCATEGNSFTADTGTNQEKDEPTSKTNKKYWAKPFSCQSCNRSFKYSRSLTEHKRNQHQNKYVTPFMCPTCKCSFMEEHFLNHAKVCAKNSDFLNVLPDVLEGDECRETNSNLDVSSLDVSKRYNFKECCVRVVRLSRNLKTTDVVSMNPFRKIRKIDNSVEGKVTNKLLEKYGYVKRGDSFRCVLCDYSCQKFSRVKHHMLVHIKRRIFQCHLCKCKFKYQESLEYHVFSKHGSEAATPIGNKKTFKCLKCHKSFREKWSLVTHVSSCSTEAEDTDTMVLPSLRGDGMENGGLTSNNEKTVEPCNDFSMDQFSETLTNGNETKMNEELSDLSFSDDSERLSIDYQFEQVDEEAVDISEISNGSAVTNSQANNLIPQEQNKSVNIATALKESGVSSTCRLCNLQFTDPTVLNHHVLKVHNKYKLDSPHRYLEFSEESNISDSSNFSEDLNCKTVNLKLELLKVDSSDINNKENNTEADVKQEITEVEVECSKPKIEDLYSIDYSDNETVFDRTSPNDSDENELKISAEEPEKDFKNLDHYTTDELLKMVGYGYDKSANVFRCSLCEHEYKFFTGIRNHMREHTRGKYECNRCFLLFQSTNTLGNHFCRENNKQFNKPFKCNLCKHRFKISKVFEKHMRICVQTGKKGTSKFVKSETNINTKTENENTNSILEEGVSTSYSNLDSKTISNADSTEITDPTGTFKLKSLEEKLLKEHGYIKISEMLYSCLICGHSTKTLYNLGRHMRLHVPSKPLQSKTDLVKKRHKRKASIERIESSFTASVITDQQKIADEQSKDDIPCSTNVSDTLKDIETITATSVEDIRHTSISDSKQSRDVNETIEVDCEDIDYPPVPHALIDVDEITDPKNMGNLNNKECDNVPQRSCKIENNAANLQQTGEEETVIEIDAKSEEEIVIEIKDDDKASYKDNSIIKTALTNDKMNGLPRTDRIIIKTQAKKSHKCSQCEKSFAMPYQLKKHLRTHSGEKLFKCSICLNRYREKSSLEYHIKTHTGEKPFKCGLCGEAFIRQLQLKYHLWNRHNCGIDNSETQESYYCKVCTKRCVTPVHLKRHMQSHRKPYKCHLCDTGFSSKGSLKRHLARHTGEKSFKCELCTKGFTTKDSLLYHMKCHTGDTPFKCNICHYAARASKQLKLHTLRKHSNAQKITIGQQSKDEIPFQKNISCTVENIKTESVKELQETCILDAKQLIGVNEIKEIKSFGNVLLSAQHTSTGVEKITSTKNEVNLNNKENDNEHRDFCKLENGAHFEPMNEGQMKLVEFNNASSCKVETDDRDSDCAK